MKIIKRNGAEESFDTAVSDFNQAMAYLVHLYGDPTHYVLSYTEASGRESTLLADPLAAEQYQADEVLHCQASWQELDTEGAGLSLNLSKQNGITLSVLFSQALQSLS